MFFACCSVCLKERYGLHWSTISHHIQKSLDTGMESYIVQIDFSVAFDRVSHSGLFSNEVYWCRWQCDVHLQEFLSNRRERVVVDGATSEWIPIVSGLPQGSVLGPHLFILYNSEMIELVEDRLYMPMLMTPYYWQLLASRQTDRLLLPPLLYWTCIVQIHTLLFLIFLNSCTTNYSLDLNNC